MTMGYRPTQAEIEAMAAAMFGADWKRLPQHQQAVLDGVIARRLDAARARTCHEECPCQKKKEAR